jgi:hypothetical protein
MQRLQFHLLVEDTKLAVARYSLGCQYIMISALESKTDLLFMLESSDQIRRSGCVEGIVMKTL